ncbi:MAG: chemotaxis protein CheW [bacterium]
MEKMTDTPDKERPSIKRYQELISKNTQIDVKDNTEETDLRKVIIFRLGNEWYGVLLKDVFEIVDIIKIYRIPCVPDYIKGVTNLRGNVVSIIDLKVFFGIGEGFEKEASEKCIVIVKCGLLQTGFMADFVEDVYSIDFYKLDAPISTIESEKAQYIVGENKMGERFLTIIETKAILEATSMQ